MRRAVSNGMMYDVNFSLTGLSAVGKPKATENKVYTCTLVPNSGKWLPHSLSVSCNSEPCRFSYDYVTGVITIPKEYVVGNIEIEAIGADYNTATTAILEVAKITSNTWISEGGNGSGTTYSSEQFILLNVYPTKGGTVNVTYGGLTKTITDDGTSESAPASQQVYFGTFKGVSDSVETPSSGTLTISGSYTAFGISSYSDSKYTTGYCGCIKNVISFGSVTKIPSNAFRNCTLKDVVIPYGVTTIGASAFGGYSLSSLSTIIGYPSCKCRSITLPESVTYIGAGAFAGNTSLRYVNIPKSVTSIGDGAFAGHHDEYEFMKVNVDLSETTRFYIENGCFCSHYDELIGYISDSPNVVIPDRVKSINANAFNCLPISSVTIPNKVEYIGSYSFAKTNLTSLYIPNSVTTIDEGAFYKDADLSNVVIDGKITEVCNYSFSHCGKVFEITLPSTLTALSSYCFQRSTEHEGGSITIHITGPQPTVAKIFGSDDHSSGGRNENLDKYNITFTVPDMSSFEQNYDDWYEYGYYYYVKEA